MRLQATLWFSVAGVTLLDGLILAQFAALLHHLRHPSWCGTWAVRIYCFMVLYGLIALPLGVFTWRCQRRAAWTMGRTTFVCARFPLLVLAALLLTYFVVLPALSGLV